MSDAWITVVIGLVFALVTFSLAEKVIIAYRRLRRVGVY